MPSSGEPWTGRIRNPPNRGLFARSWTGTRALPALLKMQAQCAHPEKAVALWGHLAIVMSYQNRTTSGWWRAYDESLRHSYSSMEDATFELNQCLFTQVMVKNSEAGLRAPTPVPLPVAQARQSPCLFCLERRQALHLDSLQFRTLLCSVWW